MAKKRSTGQVVAIAIGAILAGMVSLTTMAICGVGTCFAVTMRDTCDHEATLSGLRVDSVTRHEGNVRIEIVGTRRPGLSDGYLREVQASQEPAEPAVAVEMVTAQDAIVFELAPPAADSEQTTTVSLTFPCRRTELNCEHPGTGDYHSLRIRLTLAVDEAGTPKVTSFDVTSGYDPGYM